MFPLSGTTWVALKFINISEQDTRTGTGNELFVSNKSSYHLFLLINLNDLLLEEHDQHNVLI